MLNFLVEQRLEEAVSRGELQNLPGEGRPLELVGDVLIPEELRVAYRILKNAGFVPPEVQAFNDIARLEQLVNRNDDDAAARASAVRKLSLLKARIEQAYYDKAVARLGR